MFLLSISCSTLRFRRSEQSESLHTLRTEILYQIWKCSAFSNKITLGWTINTFARNTGHECDLPECRVPEHREDLNVPLRTEGSASLKLRREHGAPPGAAEGARCPLVPSAGKAGTVPSLTAIHSRARFHFSAMITSEKNNEWLLSSQEEEGLTCCCAVPFESVC